MILHCFKNIYSGWQDYLWWTWRGSLLKNMQSQTIASLSCLFSKRKYLLAWCVENKKSNHFCDWILLCRGGRVINPYPIPIIIKLLQYFFLNRIRDRTRFPSIWCFRCLKIWKVCQNSTNRFIFNLDKKEIPQYI